jgi:hypothetical protein
VMNATNLTPESKSAHGLDLLLLALWLACCFGSYHFGPDRGSVVAQFHAGNGPSGFNLNPDAEIGLGLPAVLAGCELKEVDVADSEPLGELLNAPSRQLVQVGAEFHRLCIVRY